MENNNKRLELLIKFFDISIVLVIAIMIITSITSWLGLSRQLEFSKYDPNNHLRLVSIYYSYFNLVKMIIVRLFFALLLWMIRQIIKSTLADTLFREGQARKIRQIARYLLYFAGLMLLTNMIYIFWIFRLTHDDLLEAVIDVIRGAFESYVLPALIMFGIAEVFDSGQKLQEDQELTI